jgi:hypothetical protein
MTNPFTIQIFSTTGEPKGIRIIEKTNWSGIGVAFPREQLSEVITEEHANRPGVYILVGDAAEETIYIGEADPIGIRLKQHLQKNWSWGVFFVDSHGLGKTEIKFLESELVRIASEYKNSILMNRNIPARPNMSRQSQAAATVFLNEILLILPMIGIRGFTQPTYHSGNLVVDDTQVESISDNFDTLVVPAKEDGFNSVFIGEDRWYAIRMNKQNIPKIKYIAAYQVAPISAVTHIAEVSEIIPYENSGKYQIKFKHKAEKIKAIPLKTGHAAQPQSPRYTLHSKIINAEFVHQLWN